MNAYEFIIKMKDYASSGIRDIARSVGMANNELSSFNTGMMKSEKTATSWGGSMSKLKGVIAGVFAVGAIWSFIGNVVTARSEYEKFEAVLTNTFQSADVGKGALNMLTDFAAKTPFALNELTGSFVKLVNRGFNPTKDELKSLGDLASSQGKGFDQITEALLDAQTGQFERLKEIGITASKSGDKVMMSFKGVNKEVANNSTAIANALLEYGRMPGVANAMSAQSSVLGGIINNLGDQWNNFLIAVGGESSGVITGVLSMLAVGLGYLTSSLPYVSEWFQTLWTMIDPVLTALGNFVKIAFRFTDAGNVLSLFGKIMSGVLIGVDLFATGLTTVIYWLSPFATQIMGAAAAWGVFNIAIGIFNALLLVSPITWIIIGIVGLITVIGLVTKYTSGWGESWKHTVNGAKFIWTAYTDYVKANFNTLVNALMIGIDKIKIGWYKFKEAVGMGNSGENQKMIAQLGQDVETRKKATIDNYKKIAESAMKAKNEFSQVGVSFDTARMYKDSKAVQNKFSNTGQKDTSTTAYDIFQKKHNGETNGIGGDKGKNKPDSIVSGGSKMTTINVTIEKLQDYTNINVESTEKGLSNLGEKVQEILLRAVNSVNQIQTN